MKYILLGLAIVMFAFGGTAVAKLGLVKSSEPWGQVSGERNTYIYRVLDKDNKVACYMAYTSDGHGNYFPEMECVKL